MRYTIDIKGLDVLELMALDAREMLASTAKITTEALAFKHLPFASVDITDDQLQLLATAGIYAEPEKRKQGMLGGDYEKVRSSFYLKARQKLLTGVGCKIGVLDSGLAISRVPVEHAVNYATADPGVGGNPNHGNFSTSIIKHPTVGLAPGAEAWFFKVINDSDAIIEAALLAAMDDCIDNHIDVVNMSLEFSSTAFNASIALFIAGGGVVVASSGNSTTDAALASPAVLPNVVAVNAIKPDGTPHYKNALAFGGKGITIACSGYQCEGVDVAGSVVTASGTSFSSPFFVGVFALYKQELALSNNYTVLKTILDKALPAGDTKYFGAGTPTF